MTRSDIYSLAIKLFGFYLLIHFILQVKDVLLIIVSNVSFGNFQDGFWMYGAILFSSIIDLLLGWITVFKTDIIIERIAPADNVTVNGSLSKIDFIEVSLAVIGVVAIIFSIPEIMAHVVESVYFHHNKETSYWAAANREEVSFAVFEGVLGIFLIFNARNFAKKICRLGAKDDDLDEAI